MSQLSKLTPIEAWASYTPSATQPWNELRARNLHRRAGLGTNGKCIRRDVEEGFEKSVQRVLMGEVNCPDGRSKEEYSELAQTLEESALQEVSLDRGSAAWVFRLLHSPQPIVERMLLAWHSHFACGARQYRNEGHIELACSLRKVWNANLSQLLTVVVESMAMQRWLDGVSNTAEQPNENLGRESLELFSLGRNQGYRERDVKEAARALTGFRDLPGNRYEVKFLPEYHDAGVKTIFGETGNWNHKDVIRLITKQPTAATHMARRLYRTFISDTDQPSNEFLEPLARVMRTKEDVEIAKGIEFVLRSRIFHESAGVANRIKHPVDFTVGTIRALDLYDPVPDTVELSRWIGKMGFRFYYPPSVAGWAGGIEWLATDAAIARANFACEIANIDKSLRKQGFANRTEWPNILATSLAGSPLSDQQLAELQNLVAAQTDDAVLSQSLVRKILTYPQAQV